MPKTHTKAGTWLHDLRRQIRRDYGKGWLIIEQSSKVKLTRPNEGSVMLDIPWAAGSTTAILNEIGLIRSRMLERGITMQEANELGKAVQARVTGRGVVLDEVDWAVVVEDFLSSGSKTDNRKNTRRPTEVRIKKALDTLNSKPKPTDGGSLMRAYARDHFAACPSGGAGRRRHLGDVGAFLRFAVTKHGLPQTWLPLTGEDLDELIGGTERSTQEELTPPVKPEALACLLDKIKELDDLGLWMAVALVGVFGLRPHELAQMFIKDGELYVREGGKRNPKSKRRLTPPEPRYVRALEIPERSDGAEAIQLFLAGTEFPKQLATQVERAKKGEDALKAVGCKFALLLNGVGYWKDLVAQTSGLTPYSLRHGYAWRAHKTYKVPIDRGTAAKLMGHSLATHDKYYGSWIDKKGIDESVNRAMGISSYG